MKKNIVFFVFFVLFASYLPAEGAEDLFPFVSEQVFEQAKYAMPELKTYPTFQYPNKGYETLPSYFSKSLFLNSSALWIASKPRGWINRSQVNIKNMDLAAIFRPRELSRDSRDGFNLKTGSKEKVLIFGYGSLINKNSLGGTNNASGKPTVKQAAVNSVRPVVVFGFKRLFNYEDQKGSPYSEFPKERAYLNLAYSSDIHSVVNGVVFEADLEDLTNLVQRELGYDLVPVLFVSWNDVITQNPHTKIQVAYTFMASSEPRNGIVYTNDHIDPIKNYFRKVEEAVRSYGPMFFEVWRNTTYLGDGKTRI